jgi:hypothetical protein
MPLTLARKLKIREGDALFLINSPADFKKNLGELPDRARIVTRPADAAQLHWFITNRAQLERELKDVVAQLTGETILWVYYPKGTSKIQTDLTRDKGWDAFLKLKNIQWLSLISFDDTWSAFGSRLKTEIDVKKEAKLKVRKIFEWIDSEKKTVRLPEDFSALLRKSRKAEVFFNSLSFTNRKEYVEWIITAKRTETRAERLSGSMERLGKGWKNPRNL